MGTITSLVLRNHGVHGGLYRANRCSPSILWPSACKAAFSFCSCCSVNLSSAVPLNVMTPYLFAGTSFSFTRSSVGVGAFSIVYLEGNTNCMVTRLFSWAPADSSFVMTGAVIAIFSGPPAQKNSDEVNITSPGTSSSTVVVSPYTHPLGSWKYSELFYPPAYFYVVKGFHFGNEIRDPKSVWGDPVGINWPSTYEEPVFTKAYSSRMK